MAAAGWKPTVDTFLGRVTKARILQAVTEAKGERAAERIAHLKKGDMAREAEALLADSGWLPEALRTQPSDTTGEEPRQGSGMRRSSRRWGGGSRRGRRWRMRFLRTAALIKREKGAIRQIQTLTRCLKPDVVGRSNRAQLHVRPCSDQIPGHCRNSLNRSEDQWLEGLSRTTSVVEKCSPIRAILLRFRRQGGESRALRSTMHFGPVGRVSHRTAFYKSDIR